MNPTQAASATRRAAEAGAAREARSRRFDDTLRTARRAAGRKSAAKPPEHDPAPPSARRAAADGKDRPVRREALRADDRAEPPRAPPTPAPSSLGSRPDPAASDLRALIRTLPVAVEAARVREGAPLALELGRALSVELRRAPGGLEVVLRPDAAVSRAAAAELPAVVRALRSRGLAIARAEVRARPDGGSRAPAPRVDVPPGVG